MSESPIASVRGLAGWVQAIRADVVAERERRARDRAVKRSRPVSAFELHFYRTVSVAAAVLVGLMFLGAR
ncbi:Putative membrane protein [Sphingopyxis fribergensis]|uniref:Putative membrane protein n=1 Tax=Sphingopyxis fribergensis TaxID=1515612 RepID=A0A0A7PLQ3_9SPHN|nr:MULTISPECIES: hypothetical protein [Sphingomonadales]AJA10924.1 Putative membrane protein [Sphingopyxis fribergensis]TNE42770.1 MAG: hypothetical protein EP345_06105 [Sphingomonadales bacterium]